MNEIIYNASPTLSRFHLSDAFVRGIRGPVGSGKSTGRCWEIFRRAREQKPAPDGKRYTRFVVVRNTYRELTDTTLKTWLDWFPEDVWGDFNRSDMAHHIRRDDIDCEVLFRALDRPDDVKKVLVTGGAGFIGSNVVDGYIDAGHEVIVVDNLLSGRRSNINPLAQFCISSLEVESVRVTAVTGTYFSSRNRRLNISHRP